MAELTNKQNKFLRGLAHELNPVVKVGQHGVNEAAIKEISRCLADHELIKIRISCDDQEIFKATLSEIESACGAETVNAIGHTVILFKRAKQPKIELPRG